MAPDRVRVRALARVLRGEPPGPGYEREARPSPTSTAGAGRGVAARRGWLAAPVVVALFLALASRPVALQYEVGGTPDRAHARLWLWAWQRGSASFTNSITGAPVVIDFRFLTGIDGQAMRTDEKTEEYYTGGTYAINERLRHERARELAYCSITGIDVTLAHHRFHVANGCLEVRLLWPPI